MIRSPLRSPLNPVLSAVVNRRRSAASDILRALFGATDGVLYRYWKQANLFQDSVGTTPVTAAGQTVGLVLDESKGLVRGPELVTNGDFSDGSTGWAVGTGWTVSGGKAEANTTHGVERLIQSWAGENNKFYVVQADITMLATPNISARVSINTGGIGQDVITVSIGSLTAGQSFTMYGVAQPTSVNPGAFLIRLGSNLNYAMNYTVDNISVRELPGNHQLQATATARPTSAVDSSSKSCISLDGLDDVLNSPATKTLKAGATLILGMQYAAGGASANYLPVFALGKDSTNYARASIRTDNGSGSADSRGASVLPTARADVSTPSAASSVPSGVPLVISMTFAAGAQTIRVNGVELAAGSNAWIEADSVANAFWSTGQTNFGVERKYYTAFGIQRVLTPTELAAAEAQVALECGVTL